MDFLMAGPHVLLYEFDQIFIMMGFLTTIFASVRVADFAVDCRSNSIR